MSENSQKKSSKEISSQDKYTASQRAAIEQFEAQLKSLGAIAATSQFQVIQDYWQRELESIEIQMDQARTPDEVFLLNIERKAIKKYLMYVKRMLEAIGKKS